MSSCSYIDKVSKFPDIGCLFQTSRTKWDLATTANYVGNCIQCYQILEISSIIELVFLFSWCFFLAPLSENLLWKLRLGDPISQHAMWNQFNRIALALHLTSRRLLDWVNWTLFGVPTTHKPIDPLRSIVKRKQFKMLVLTFRVWNLAGQRVWEMDSQRSTESPSTKAGLVILFIYN